MEQVKAEAKLNVINFNPDNLTITVDANITNQQLNEVLAGTNLFFPSLACNQNVPIGVQIANNFNILRSMQFGEWTDNILGMEFMLASGKIINTGGKTFKNVSGYDLIPLLVGTSDMIGVIKKVILKLTPMVEKVSIISGQLSMSKVMELKEKLDLENFNVSAITIEAATEENISINVELMGDSTTVLAQQEKLQKLIGDSRVTEIVDVYNKSLAMDLPLKGILVNTKSDQFFNTLATLKELAAKNGTNFRVQGDLNHNILYVELKDSSATGKIIAELIDHCNENIAVEGINISLPETVNRQHNNHQLTIIENLKDALMTDTVGEGI
ncbi:MAG: FAD-binding oxidoreductase [Bacillota bacterium]|nr:FAD-binding oxidoreductase [Bacillota bacterium]